MTGLAGTWALTISTPIGSQAVTLEISDAGGALAGTAASAAESVPLLDLTTDGDRARWTQRITRPMRLNLTFDVVVDGDTMRGTSKAGRLPSSRVSGARIPGLPNGQT